ncbi:hypothetical protein NUG13_12475 [Bacillus subtilis]|uniref:Uncharacterized protein n=1 Tax=Bacillus phage vB_BsuS_PJN02 TaxID=2920374 RepID=A0AC61TS99_9CAUD|nr:MULTISPECIES: hypothetical protein [Bacillus subtilis group]YP_010681843.1 hypothetical protein PQE76_gp225 [Bacillus phage vB_BsuS_PJN02]MCR4362146.1 hypothetical protein [Bacillus subtilis]UNH58568.1 hypothetical protein [Bacillus phage vB_BsuS_PJN02]UQB84253.1 hypothetical protein KMZ31_20280 [Bacillus amyloliquefaciens]WOF32877.1 hypothetical protein OEJ84_23550 [Bacillus subtilis]
MTTYNVACKSCEKGNICLPNGYDGFAEFYEIHCTDCDSVSTVHYTGMDAIIDEDLSNNQSNKDVQLLNKNGFWKHEKSFDLNNFNINKYTEGMHHIQTIEEYEVHHYFQNGSNFINICLNVIHNKVDILSYQAKPEGMPVLMEYFFKTS